jgi:protein phosphatase
VSGARDDDTTRALNEPQEKGGEGEVLLQVSARSDRGLVRENNEDSFVVADLSMAPGDGSGDTTAGVGRVGRKGVLLAVSDGMGGQEAGEVASRMAVEILHQTLRHEWTGRAERDAAAEIRNDLRIAVDRANKAVLEHVEKHPQLTGMGATLTAVVILGGRLVLAHVGDSRCYLLRDGFLKVLTADQSLAEELVRRGVVQRDTAAYAARRSVLTRVVGQAAPLVPDSELADLARGDRILLCTDGLYGPVDDETIRDILVEASDPDSAAEQLVEAARARGAPDNVTCVAAWLSGDGLPQPASLDAGGGTMSVRLDARLAAAAGEDTLALALSRKDATGEFEPGKVLEDDTLRGPLPAKAAAAADGQPRTITLDRTSPGSPGAPSPAAGAPPSAPGAREADASLAQEATGGKPAAAPPPSAPGAREADASLAQKATGGKPAARPSAAPSTHAVAAPGSSRFRTIVIVVVSLVVIAALVAAVLFK